jgi:hypothetical protein
VRHGPVSDGGLDNNIHAPQKKKKKDNSIHFFSFTFFFHFLQHDESNQAVGISCHENHLQER